jgi:hypothetical protein
MIADCNRNTCFASLLDSLSSITSADHPSENGSASEREELAYDRE